MFIPHTRFLFREMLTQIAHGFWKAAFAGGDKSADEGESKMNAHTTANSVIEVASTQISSIATDEVSQKPPNNISACPHQSASKLKSCSALNARNLMPTDLTKPSDAVSTTLPDIRQISSIPKTAMPNSGEDQPDSDKWVYPSQQQFYESMKRKNHSPDPDQMAVIVPMHNAMNERAWAQLLQWEEKYKSQCDKVTLKSFQGLPDSPSLRARWNALWGTQAPFDRHDWTIDRCGQEVTYILDFYQGKPEKGALMSVYIDVRPKIDSFQVLCDRIENWLQP
jgi:cytochrome c heme-lyase